MKILAVSDLHADWTTAGVARYEDVESSLERAVERAIDWKADLFAFAGDLADPDSQRVHLATALAARTAKRLKDSGIQSIWIAGNHDVVTDGTGATTLSALKAAFDGPMVRVDETPTCHVGWIRNDLAIVTLPYCAPSHNYSPATFVEAVRSRVHSSWKLLVVGHLMLEGIEPGSETTDMARGRDVFWPLEAIRELRKDRRVVCIGGHYHRRQDYEGVHIVGSLERLTFGEEGNAPGWLEVEL